ncbi:MAG: hypothetical protein HZA91_05910 [Verrucomicrobia bacterium]|nr:hypothetical protein [Verrucomicrobiota bacterium]
MSSRMILSAILLLGVCAPCPADVTLSLADATITLDARGCVTSLRAAGKQEYAPPGAPAAFEATVDGERLVPTAVARKGRTLTVEFGERGRMQFAITEGRGFAFLKLTELALKGDVERLQLFCLPVKGPQKIGSAINACYDDRFAAAVMGTEINVRPRLITARAAGGDNKDCTHQFEQVANDVKQGRHAARFTAESRRGDNAGWSVAGRPFAKPLDLRGCRALRAWVHGDGNGQSLKIQMSDGKGGYRDDYLKVDFNGWRQVTLATPALNTLRYDHVSQLNFYYNSLPAKRTVSCLLDGVEAVLGDAAESRTATLEDFEDTTSALWPFPATRLMAETTKQFGVQPAGVGIIACPRAQFEKAIERFEHAAGLPSPRVDGVWAKTSPATKRSYLFITNFAEKDTDDVIAFAKRGRFDAILIVQSSWCSSTGHYPINTKNFPRGLDSLKATFARLKRAGFKVGLHYLAPSIYPPDPYLTPVPDARLVRDASAELAADVDAKAAFIATTAAPEKFPAEDGGYDGEGAVIQIGTELIRYTERAMKPPFGFSGCARGLHGTAAAAHGRGERLTHLRKSYGYFLFDMDTNLIDEVADSLARVVNAVNADMVYWDGSERLQGDHGYYNAKLQKAFYDRFKNKNMLLQGSSYSHYSWHIHARYASADGHGDLKGYLDERTPAFANYFNNLMPLDIGWYYVYDTKTTTDQFEYVLNKSLGFNSSISLQTSPKHLREHPYIDVIVDLVGAYERLRLGGKVPAETRATLREPKCDYRLIREGRGSALQRVIYEPWRDITALDGKTNVWETVAAEGPCRVGVEIQVPVGQWAAPGPSYRAKGSILIEDFSDPRPYGKIRSTFPGVTQSFDIGAYGDRQCAVYSATSLHRGGWSVVGRAFDPPLDISTHKGIGFWLRGDGKGAQFKLQLRDGKGAADYYITNNYTGWRYHQLVRPEKDAIDYRRVAALSFYYNGLPAGTNVTCAIDDLRALPALDEPSLVGPAIEIAGQTLSWPVTLLPGQTFAYWPDEGVRISIGERKGPIQRFELPATITLPPGKHTVKFTASGPLTAVPSVRLTLQLPERLPVTSGARKW